jgi:hypothetical protein
MTYVVYVNQRLAEGLIAECRWYELALRRHGFTTERLMHLARKVAADGCRKRGAALGDRFDDLVSRLQLAGLQAALRYDPEREHRGYGSNGGDPFTSYVADVMDRRIDDHFRSRSEGFSDRRYGNYGEVTPTDQIEQQRADVEDAIANMDSAANLDWYAQAAAAEGLKLTDWVVRALNARASQTVDRPTRTRSENRKTDAGPDYWPGAQVVNA